MGSHLSGFTMVLPGACHVCIMSFPHVDSVSVSVSVSVSISAFVSPIHTSAVVLGSGEQHIPFERHTQTKTHIPLALRWNLLSYPPLELTHLIPDLCPEITVYTPWAHYTGNQKEAPRSFSSLSKTKYPRGFGF